MSFLSKHSFQYKSLRRLKYFGSGRMGERKITVYHRHLAEDKSKDSGAENVGKENTENNKDDNTDVMKGKEESAVTEAETKSRFSNYVEEVKESRREYLKGRSGYYVKPTNRQKLALLWAKKYPTRDDIPETVVHQEIIYAENTVRTVTLYWMLLTMFITFITLIKCGQSRKRIYHEKIRKKQEKIFHDREERFEKQLAESKN
ncbi:uncharacterized protein LOC132727304 [Ruditapes philippinarum]|uniref:uncharacterized protein LOC132727304 n=1 Tax=Ruditapes philippinarum TaxID=129788 RepID=UPI00295B88BB|nr:uncharacterized protein LOC132727304 [Ruditapes philippinarum]